MHAPNTLRGGPDERGHFGVYGGRFVAETLMPIVLAVEAAYDAARRDSAFHAELDHYLEHYVGRPSPLYFARANAGSSLRLAPDSTVSLPPRPVRFLTFLVSSTWVPPISSGKSPTSSG